MWPLPLSQFLLFWVAYASILMYMFNSRKDMYSSSVFSFLFLFGGLCPHIQFPQDMCTSMVVILVNLTCKGVLLIAFDLQGSP